MSDTPTPEEVDEFFYRSRNGQIFANGVRLTITQARKHLNRQLTAIESLQRQLDHEIVVRKEFCASHDRIVRESLAQAELIAEAIQMLESGESYWRDSGPDEVAATEALRILRGEPTQQEAHR